jgi:hypothetical protein
VKCRIHPAAEAVAVCQKFGQGYCIRCCQSPPEGEGCACSSPKEHCKFRKECLVYFAERRMKKGLRGM